MTEQPLHRPVNRRITFLAWRDLGHPEAGGSELFVERVAQHLCCNGWDVTIRSAEYEGGRRDEIVEGVRIRRRGGRLTIYVRGLAYLLGRQGRRSDVVVDVQNGIPFFAPLVRRQAIVNLLHHVHREQWQIIYPGRVGHLGWWLESKAAPRLYRRHSYVTVSESTRRDLTELGIEGDRVDVVYNGVDVPHPEHLQARAGAPTICVLGRLVPHKQVEQALQVVAELRTTFPGLRVDVLGEGWWREHLEAAALELGVADLVRFHGHVTNAERDELLDRSWVLLAPSVKEGWGIAIMEAAARGVPAIAYSWAGGVCESIVDGETGWLVDDVAGLVKRTDEMLRDKQLREAMGQAARERAAAFSWSCTGVLFADIVDRVAKAAPKD